MELTDTQIIDLGLQLVVTLIGIGGGVFTALWFDRRKKKQDLRDTVNSTLDAIIKELNEDIDGIKDYQKEPILWKEDKRDFRGNLPTVITPAYDSAINSGNFSLLPPDLQIEIGDAYLRGQRIKVMSDQVLNFHASSVYTDEKLSTREATRICKITNFEVEKFLKEIDNLLPKLKSAKKN